MEGPGATIRVEGHRDLIRALKLMPKAHRRALRKEFREVGQIVATEASSIARANGLVDSGALARDIRPQVVTRGVRIQAFAARDGYNYPRRHEFENYEARAFMAPALERKRGEAEQRLEKAFDKVEEVWGS